jgi:(p)ppGpp synthase/HD superfamily hydrolase
MDVAGLGKGQVTTEKLLGYITEHFSQENAELAKQAYDFAVAHFASITHPTGKAYLDYTAELALFFNDLYPDPIMFAAILLYLPPIASASILAEIKDQFQHRHELLKLVDAMARFEQFEYPIWPLSSAQTDGSRPAERTELIQKAFLLAIDESQGESIINTGAIIPPFQKKVKQAENLIRMMLSATPDMRVLLFKLADRLLYIKLLKNVPDSQKETADIEIQAKITLSIYARLADRLGIWHLKSELEDMSFRLLDPGMYKEIVSMLKTKREERHQDIQACIALIQEQLDAYGIDAEVSGRPKHLYSIYQKMQAKQLTFEQVNDLLGVRIIAASKPDCYDARDIVLDNWPVRTDFYEGQDGRDWIATPKENQYQSLHTTVMMNDKIVEIQIRTREMHEIAEYGIAAEHWRYKESKSYRKGKSPQVGKMKDRIWSEQLSSLSKDVKEARANFSAIQPTLSQNFIFVLTPQGHIIDMPGGATALDFAYRIHTEIGNTYTGAKVNGRFVRAEHILKTGDTIEILTSRARKGPNPEWLSKSKLDDELIQKLDTELRPPPRAEEKKSSQGEPPIPQWLYLPQKSVERKPEKTKQGEKTKKDEEIKPKKVKQREEIKPEEMMYYVFARTRSARHKIRRWFNTQQHLQL